jgi:uncharacterized membrane protein YeaQ/YmgE (transglycosylase-associated protein family)
MHETYGLKIAYIIAGFIGGIVSLKFVQDMNRWAAVLAVFTGAAGANYGTPVILHYIALEQSLEYPAAFFVGLTSLNLIPLVIKASEKFNLLQLIKK